MSLDFNFVFAMEVRFAVVAHNGQSRTPVPTNKAFVLAIEMKFAVGVCDVDSFHHSVVPLPRGGRLGLGVSLYCKGEVGKKRL